MKMRKKILLAMLSVSLTAGSSLMFSTEALCAPAQAVPIEYPVRPGEVFYQNSGMRFFVPKDLDGLLLTAVTRKGEAGPGRLFSVWERASVEAAKAIHRNEDSAGWLFDIGWLDENSFHKLLCDDVSGAEIFARDPSGNRMVFYHPTDVRYMREDDNAMQRDEKQWRRLTDWAWNSVRKNFILDNIYSNIDDGITAESYDDSIITVYLARVAYRPGTKYTISASRFGPLQSSEVKAAPFVERLIRNAKYEPADSAETPEGEYFSLDLSGENTRLDFFLMTGKENHVRVVTTDGRETLYKATFVNDSIKASGVMQRWYWELANRSHKG